MKENIIHIEDNPGDAFLLKDAMNNCNGKVNIVNISDGEEALQLLFGKTDIKASLFIIDLNLPKVDGMTVLEKIKNSGKYKNIPVIIFTTSNNPEDIEDCKKLGADFYLVKPFNLSGFNEIINLICSYF